MAYVLLSPKHVELITGTAIAYRQTLQILHYFDFDFAAVIFPTSHFSACAARYEST